MTRTRTHRHDTRNARTTRASRAAWAGIYYYAGGGAGCYIQAHAHPPTRDPPNHTATVPTLYTYYFAHYTTYPQKHPPIQCQIKTPHPHIFPATICLARTQEDPPSSFQIQHPHPLFFKKSCHLTCKTRAVVFVIAFCHAMPLEGVVLPSVRTTPSFPFTFPPSCCYTHAFTASLKPDAAPHARNKNRTH